jgi:hypothetical protein
VINDCKNKPWSVIEVAVFGFFVEPDFVNQAKQGELSKPSRVEGLCNLPPHRG